MTAYFLAAQPSTLGLGTGLEAPFSPPITISEKTDSLLSVCLFLVTTAKCIRGSAVGAEEPAMGRWVVIQSQAILEEAMCYCPLGASFCFCPHSYALTEKYPKVKKNYWWLSVKISQIRLVGRKES